MDSTMNPKGEQWKDKKLGHVFLAHTTLWVGGRAGAPGWGLRRVTSKSITHTNLHKSNNKLIIV